MQIGSIILVSGLDLKQLLDRTQIPDSCSLMVAMNHCLELTLALLTRPLTPRLLAAASPFCMQLFSFLYYDDGALGVILCRPGLYELYFIRVDLDINTPRSTGSTSPTWSIASSFWIF